MVPEVEDSVAVGLRLDGDMAIVLFVKLKPSQFEDHRGSLQVRIDGLRPRIFVDRRLFAQKSP